MKHSGNYSKGVEKVPQSIFFGLARNMVRPGAINCPIVSSLVPKKDANPSLGQEAITHYSFTSTLLKLSQLCSLHYAVTAFVSLLVFKMNELTTALTIQTRLNKRALLWDFKNGSGEQFLKKTSASLFPLYNFFSPSQETEISCCSLLARFCDDFNFVSDCYVNTFGARKFVPFVH